MEKLILIDGNSLINRAFYALPPLNNPKGEPIQAVYGFCTMLIKAITDYRPNYMAVAFDMHAPTFRHKMYGEYKAGRRKMPDDLRVQIPMLKRALELMGIKTLELETYEADDIIGTMAKHSGVTTYILTADRDCLQLIDNNVTVYLTKRGLTEIDVVSVDNIAEKFGVAPQQIPDYKALAGDSSDNIPGVPGVGDKTATSMLAKHGTVENLYEHLDEYGAKTREKLIDGKQSAFMSKTLATINCDVPINCKLADCAFNMPFKTAVKRYFIDMDFRSLYKRDDLFTSDDGADIVVIKRDYVVREIKHEGELMALAEQKPSALSFYVNEEGIATFSTDGITENIVTGEYNLFDAGITLEQVVNILKPVLESEKTVKYLFGAKDMLHKLSDYDVNIKNYHDVKLMQFLLDPLRFNDSAEAYFELLGYDKTKIACELYNIFPILMKELKSVDLESLYINIELPLEKVLFDMETEGVLIDKSVMESMGKSLKRREIEYTERIFELAGCKFNLNSPKQLAVVLFDTLALPYPKKEKKRSTGAEILEQLRDEYEIVDLILKYRFVSKLNSVYIEGVRKLIDENGRVHTEYKQTLTATGRLSSVEPNLQNIPVREPEGRELRAMFVAGEDRQFVAADYSQIELRLIAHLSGDPTMLEIYKNGGDIHKQTAQIIFGVPESEVTDDMRRRAKTINFGVIYGMSEYGLAQSLHCSAKEAAKFIEQYFNHFVNIKQYFDKIIDEAKKTGIVTTMLGRRRRITELSSSNYALRTFGERAAMNTPLQGTAADIIKIAMLKVHERLKNMKSKLILQIHDELIVEATCDEVEEVRAILKDCMENAVELSLPLTVEVNSGKSWLEC